MAAIRETIARVEVPSLRVKRGLAPLCWYVSVRVRYRRRGKAKARVSAALRGDRARPIDAPGEYRQPGHRFDRTSTFPLTRSSIVTLS